LLFGLVSCAATSPELGTYSMHVESVRVDPQTSSPVVLLREEAGMRRSLPIWIGVYEAQSIAMAMEKVESPRPNTHDLIQNLLDGIRGKLRRVVITELRDNTYYAALEIELNGNTVAIDSRPSDAIAIAVRTGAPVFATEQVLEAADQGGGDAPPLEIRSPGSRAPDDLLLRTQ
jgi:hypothetical protein